MKHGNSRAATTSTPLACLPVRAGCLQVTGDSQVPCPPTATPLPRPKFFCCAALNCCVAEAAPASVWSKSSGIWNSESNLGARGSGRTVWDLVGDAVCAALDAVRLFLNLLSPVAVHGHHGKGRLPCIGTTAGMTSYHRYQSRELARVRHGRAAGTIVDTRELLSTIVSYPCDDWEENVTEGRRITERHLLPRSIQSEYWPTSRANRYPESSDA